LSCIRHVDLYHFNAKIGVLVVYYSNLPLSILNSYNKSFEKSYKLKPNKIEMVQNQQLILKRSVAIFCILLIAACQDKTPPSDVIQYDFTDQFNSVNVKDVTPPADPAITYNDPEPATYSGETAEYSGLIADITDGTSDSNTETIIAEVSTFVSASFDTEAETSAANLNAQTVSDLISNPLDENAKTLAANALNNQDILDLNLLPTLTYSFDGGAKKDLVLPDVQSINLVDFSGYPGDALCYSTAVNTYEDKIKPAQEAKDNAQISYQNTLQQRLLAADERQDDRAAALQAEIEAYLNTLASDSNELLDAISNLSDSNDEETLKQLTYIYAIVGKLLLETYSEEGAANLDALNEAEIQEAEERYLSLLEDLEAIFEDAIAQAYQILLQAFASCHNQGG
jgi:hypothetical protein